MGCCQNTLAEADSFNQVMKIEGAEVPSSFDVDKANHLQLSMEDSCSVIDNEAKTKEKSEHEPLETKSLLTGLIDGSQELEPSHAIFSKNPEKSKFQAKFFVGLVNKAAEVVQEQGENIEAGKEFKQAITKSVDLIGESLEQPICEGLKQSALLIQQQASIIKDGLNEAISLVQDLNIKKRLTDIVHPILRRVFIHSHMCDIEEKYEILEVIGNGRFSTVRKVVDKITRLDRAVKFIIKSTINEQKTGILVDEVEALKSLDHPNIIRVIEIVEDVSKLCIVTELCTGGELLERIAKTQEFDEDSAARLMYQILSGLVHMRNKGYVHRDIRPENILFTDEQSDVIKIIDFGIAKGSEELKITRKLEHKDCYISPEEIEGRELEKSDLWSCGVMLYTILSGSPPFTGKTEDELFHKIRRAVFNFSGRRWKKISKEAKDLIERMLCKNVKKRISAEDAWNHCWIQRTALDERSKAKINPKTLKRLENFTASTRLQQATLSFIASSMISSKEIEELRAAFVILDTNGDGHLSTLELSRGFTNLALSASVDVEAVLKRCDIDLNGMIDYNEFITATLDWQKHLSHEMLESVFKSYDTDNSGTISLLEVKDFLGNDGVDDAWQQIFTAGDENGDGVIDLREFKRLMMEVFDKRI